MIKMEAYRQRLEREEGLSFIEFNYQLLQAYDFLLLFQRYGCTLQMGGDDQWSNILAGIDLIRRIDGKIAYGLTFPLLTTARGEKMGKTAKGAVWLSASRTSPYEFYQYWINTDDRDVERFLAYFTFLPMHEVRRLGGLKDSALREAKEVLAYEVTKLAHGEVEAKKAREASRAGFGGEEAGLAAIPTTVIDLRLLTQGIPVIDLFIEAGLTNSKGASRRLIQQGGAYINGQQVKEVATFGYIAATQFAQEFKEKEFIPYASHELICTAIAEQAVQYGVVAVENSIDGIIPETVRAVERNVSLGVHVCGEGVVPVEHYLLRKGGISAESEGGGLFERYKSDFVARKRISPMSTKS